jgi:glycosyltransferase involved in cell wall biosynthesis
VRIALVAPGFPPKEVGGTEVASQRYSEALAKRGHDVTVLTRGTRAEPREDAGYEVREVFRDVHLASLHTPGMFRGLLRAVKELRPDVVHGQAFFGHTWFCVQSKRLMGVPVLAYGRGSDVYHPEGRVGRKVVRDILRGADAVVAQTAHMARRMREVHPREIHVVPNGVDVDRFRCEREGISGRTVLYVGRFRPVKNVPLAIEAFRMLKESMPDVELHVAGDGPEAESVARAAERTEGVRLVGDVPNEDVPALMAEADVLLLSSDTEGFPMTLLEAMASGLPIVATAVSGVPEIIEDGIHGVLAPRGDAVALAQGMERLLTDEGEWLRVSRRNAREAAHYSWDAVCERMETIYRGMLGPANG